MTVSPFDFFNYSTTDASGTTALDERRTNIDTSTSHRDYGDYDMVTEKEDIGEEYDDYDDGALRRRRRRKKRSNDTVIDYFNYYDEDDEGDKTTSGETVSTAADDEIDNTTFSSITFDDYTTANDTIDAFNQTDFISSTIASFVANITSTEWPDEMNTTYASELWTEYVTTLNSSWTDEYYVDENENETEKICYTMRCEVIDRDEDDEDTTTPIAILTTTTTLTSTKATTAATMPIRRIEPPKPSKPACPTPSVSSAIAALLPTTMSTGNDTRYSNATAYNDQRKYCWETMFGQELVKLTVLDLVSTECPCTE